MGHYPHIKLVDTLHKLILEEVSVIKLPKLKITITHLTVRSAKERGHLVLSVAPQVMWMTGK
jgi:hypothetical protein